MVTELDTDLVPDIAALIQNELGTAAMFKVLTTVGTYTPGTSRKVGEVSSLVSWKITPPQPYKLAFVDGDLIQMGDLTTITSAQDIPFTPSHIEAVGTSQYLTFDGATWRIISVNPIRSGDLLCAYELQLRKGAASA